MSENTTPKTTGKLTFVPMTMKNGEAVPNLEYAMDDEHVYVRASRNVTPAKSKTGKSYVLAATAGCEIPGLGENDGYFRGTFGMQLSSAEKKVAARDALRAELAKLEADLKAGK